MSVAEDKAVGAGEGQQSKEQFRDFFKTYNKMSEVRECTLPYQMLKFNIYLKLCDVNCDLLQTYRRASTNACGTSELSQFVTGKIPQYHRNKSF